MGSIPLSSAFFSSTTDSRLPDSESRLPFSESCDAASQLGTLAGSAFSGGCSITSSFASTSITSSGISIGGGSCVVSAGLCTNLSSALATCSCKSLLRNFAKINTTKAPIHKEIINKTIAVKIVPSIEPSLSPESPLASFVLDAELDDCSDPLLSPPLLPTGGTSFSSTTIVVRSFINTCPSSKLRIITCTV